MTSNKPVILGGKLFLKEKLEFVHPFLPKVDEIRDDLERTLDSGIITNNGPNLLKFEKELARFLGVKHCVAVANGTLGIMLVLKALEIKGEVILPSFTFAATALAASWCGLKLKFADMDPFSFTIDPKSAAKNIGQKTSAIIGVHIFGNPCDTTALTRLAKQNKVHLIFDAAHALGSLKGGKHIGSFGDAEVFSFHATKLVAMGEGGAVATNSSSLAQKIRALRNFGDISQYNYLYTGLNAKLSEMPAMLGLYGLRHLPYIIKKRKKLFLRYRKALHRIPGIGFQNIGSSDTPNYQYLPIILGKNFGFDSRQMVSLLGLENIETRSYFYPPVHLYPCYRGSIKTGSLPQTNDCSKRILCLPLHLKMNENHVDAVASAIKRIYSFRGEIMGVL